MCICWECHSRFVEVCMSHFSLGVGPREQTPAVRFILQMLVPSEPILCPLTFNGIPLPLDHRYPIISSECSILQSRGSSHLWPYVLWASLALVLNCSLFTSMPEGGSVGGNFTKPTDTVKSWQKSSILSSEIIQAVPGCHIKWRVDCLKISQGEGCLTKSQGMRWGKSPSIRKSLEKHHRGFSCLIDDSE